MKVLQLYNFKQWRMLFCDHINVGWWFCITLAWFYSVFCVLQYPNCCYVTL